jgi:MFS transporter, DHA1 family, tetracycline resistance protein
MPAHAARSGQPGQLGPGVARKLRPAVLLEPWFAPFALINGSAVGLVPILLPVVASRYGIGHVGVVMGAFNLGAFAAPIAGNVADRHHAYRLISAVCAAATAVTLCLFAFAGPWPQVLLALINGAAFAAAVTVANLLIVERQPKPQWNQRLGWLETALSIGQGGALLLAAWLAGLHARPALLGAAIVPAAAIPLALLLIPRMTSTGHKGAAAPAEQAAPAAQNAVGAAAGQAAGQTGGASPPTSSAYWRRTAGHVGEWGPASPSRSRHLHGRKPFQGFSTVLRSRFGWLLAAWIPAYSGTAVIFALYPVLFKQAFDVAPDTSALAFAVIVFVSLPLFAVAGRVSQRHGPAVSIVGAFGARIVLLAALAALADVGHVPGAIPLAAFAGIMFGWSFLSVAAPDLTAELAPGDEGDAQGALNAGSGIAGLTGSLVGGFAADQWGYPAALAIGAALVAVGLAVFVATVMRHTRADAHDRGKLGVAGGPKSP